MQTLQFGSYTVTLQDNPLKLEIFDQNNDLISQTGETSTGMLLTMNVAGLNNAEINDVIYKALKFRNTQ